MQLSPIGMDRSVMTTLSFPKILSAVTAISYFGTKNTFLTKYVFRCHEFGNHDTEKAPWNGKKIVFILSRLVGRLVVQPVSEFLMQAYH